MRHCLSSIALAAVALFIAGGAIASARGGAAKLLLTRTDVGPDFAVNRSITQTWTLRERLEGLPAPIKAELRKKWVAGAQTGFDGDASVSHEAILSTADEFQTSSVARIVRTWQSVFLRNGRGTRLSVPASAPAGASRFLMRGRMLTGNTKLEVKLFLWRQNRAVLSVWLIGRPGIPRVSDLMVLAHRQAARAAAAHG